jgi:hypothetical protein
MTMYISTSNAVFGPFQTITPLADRLHADGVDYPFAVLGEYKLLTNDQYIPPSPSPPAPPEAVTPVQFRRALRQSGLYDVVAAYVATQDDDTQDAWEYAISISRTDNMVVKITEALGQSNEQIDNLFRLAATL